MMALTKRQETVRRFIDSELKAGRACPTHREIAARFGFSSSYGAARHINALVKKGILTADKGKARSLRVQNSYGISRSMIADIPLFGSIPAGIAEMREQEVNGCISIDIATIGFKPTARTFALEVRGDSMIGKHIVSGDIVVVEHGQTPHDGDVVAALIDGESTLKTFVANKGKPYLKAENAKYPKQIPAGELVIQGVMVALIRKRK